MPEMPPIALRNARVQTAVALGTPDRVPFIPCLGNIYALSYGPTIQEIMGDARKAIPAMEQLCADIDPDLLYPPNFYPIKAMELAGATTMRWPGEKWGLPPNTPFQALDATFLEDDDYDAFIKDPTAYALNRILPRKYEQLGGLAMLNPIGMCGTTALSLAGAALPPVRAALEALMAASQASFEYIGGLGEVCMRAVQMGYPLWGHAVMFNPFDEFADCVRGLLNTVSDLVTDPEKVAAAVERYGDATIPAGIALGKAQHVEYMMVPLHTGVDEFMSPDNYNKYYWPPLKRVINAILEAGMTPILICEGNYNTRLDTLTDVPAGKLMYMFEKVNLKAAKAKLGKTACIGIPMTTANLIAGRVDDVVRETKELLDICAPGGGCVMTNSVMLDNVNMDNVRAWHQTTIEYGKYS